ncbi:MAG: bifunctional acetate--CoA ligase family protein/GNAT family N-acetyltransferase [Oligoflexia bacterium]|nr:bifunctional acetate--CoA ligase family protein/GNAT family N-acetyltransferase [Oligoflexia bacterium]
MPHPLRTFFAPKNVAVIGATEKTGSVGRDVLVNLATTSFGGKIFPINPNRSEVLGHRAYASLSAVPEPIDLAVVATPAATVPEIIRQCGEARIPSVVVLSAGFKEIGPEGLALEQQVLAEAKKAGVRVIGPNCLGVMCPLTGLNATFAAKMGKPGNVGFISQSGALCTAVLDWSLRENVGFSHFISIGSMVDVGWGDLIDYLGSDPNTQSIVIYMESIGNARAFLSAAREVALEKPIVVIKPGRTPGAAKAAASHTGALTGSDEVLEAAFRRCGVLRVDSISELFNMAEVLSKQPAPKGPRLTILTNAGGPGVLATDALILGGGELTQLSTKTTDTLNRVLPSVWSHGNPVDIIGDASPERYAKSIEVVARDPNSDGLLVILTPQAMTDPTKTAEQVASYAKIPGKPILASWMGGTDVEAGDQILNRAGIPTFAYPDTAVTAFNSMWRYTYNLRGIYETPSILEDGQGGGVDRASVEKILAQAKTEKRMLLTEYESKAVLSAYGIPTVQTELALDEESAVQAAKRIGFPVVLKLNSTTITHKTDVGGVQLNLCDADAVRGAWSAIRDSVSKKVGPAHFQGVTVQAMVRVEGYEIILGSSLDAQFGPVLLFGTGGQLVEVFKDHALALPPLNTTLARRMMEQTKIYKALKGVRGRAPVDLPGLEKILVRFSQLVVEQPWIKEIDINPLMVSSDRIVALDARVALHHPETKPEQLPVAAIRPYPIQYASEWKPKRGEPLCVRPIRPEDEPLMVSFHQNLTDRDVYLRYLEAISLVQRTSHQQLIRSCAIDYDREMALVAETQSAGSGPNEIVAVARLTKVPGTSEAQIALVVTSSWQRRGVGAELFRRLLKFGADEKLSLVRAEILADNQGGISLLRNLGFTIEPTERQGILEATYRF